MTGTDLMNVPATAMHLTSGGILDLADPDPALINFGDIITSLSRQARYNGQGRFFYSVAEHSLMVCQLVMQRHPCRQNIGLWMAALLHDAHEAYIGDITKPMQALLGEDAAAQREKVCARLDQAIFARAGIFCPTEAEAAIIKQADRDMTVIEIEALFGPSHSDRFMRLPIAALVTELTTLSSFIDKPVAGKGN